MSILNFISSKSTSFEELNEEGPFNSCFPSLIATAKCFGASFGESGSLIIFNKYPLYVRSVSSNSSSFLVTIPDDIPSKSLFKVSNTSTDTPTSFAKASPANTNLSEILVSAEFSSANA